MTFQIATGERQEATPRLYDGVVSYRDHGTRAERKHRQIIAAIGVCETVQEVEDILIEEDLALDAMLLDFPDYLEAVKEAADDHKAILRHASEPDAAVPAPISASAKTKEAKGTNMFNINTSTGGESGPFLNYKNRAGAGMGDGTWYMRSKDGDDWHYEDMTAKFNTGFVADIYATHDGQLGGTLKLGFIKFNDGAAPDRHIWASPLQDEPRRSDEKTATGGMAWQNLVNFRMAVGGGGTALFDVNGWSGYKGVMALIAEMNKGFSENIGKAPLVQYTGFRVEGSGQKRLHVPEFKIAQWVDVPDCLKADAPAISTSAQPEKATEAAVQAATANAAPASSVPAEGTF